MSFFFFAAEHKDLLSVVMVYMRFVISFHTNPQILI